MFDKNGVKIERGDAVMISGGYFKADNGLYKVTHAPGNHDWCGSDYGLSKLNKNGTLSTGKYSTAFWPLMVTTNSRETRYAAKDHNATHAAIEVVEKSKAKYNVKKTNRDHWRDVRPEGFSGSYEECVAHCSGLGWKTHDDCGFDWILEIVEA